jgi:hypothetical protein
MGSISSVTETQQQGRLQHLGAVLEDGEGVAGVIEDEPVDALLLRMSSSKVLIR